MSITAEMNLTFSKLCGIGEQITYNFGNGFLIDNSFKVFIRTIESETDHITFHHRFEPVGDIAEQLIYVLTGKIHHHGTLFYFSEIKKLIDQIE